MENRMISALQKAIEVLENTKTPSPLSSTHIAKNAAIEVAVAAIRKQIPKKPIHDSLADRACPTCDAYIPFDALNDRLEDAPNHCKHCGQALDWEIPDIY